jgi:diguanylate cyclase (GGDEF)-like protein
MTGRHVPAGAGGMSSEGGVSTPPRLLALVLPVSLGGAALVVAAAWSFASAVSWSVLAGVAVLLAAAVVAEAFPVPMESLPGGYVSLAAVFVVGTAFLHGWAAAAIVASLTRVALEIVQRRPLIKLVYNGAVYALGGAAAGGAVAAVGSSGHVETVLLSILAGASAFYAVNVVLVAAVIACWASQPFARLLWSSAYWTAVPFAIMASVSLMLVVLWRDAPVYAFALVGPLVATVLYQRSTHNALKAMRLALTDQVTGLGNNRHFHERLQAELARAEAERFPLTLCMIDLDDFKDVNDGFGHPVGDAVLAEVADALRHGGDAFRIGGDEFALLLPGRELSDGVETAHAIIRRLRGIEFGHGGTVTFSAGVASYPSDGVERTELIRLADVALYRAKGDGKNRVRAYERHLREVDRSTAAAL